MSVQNFEERVMKIISQSLPSAFKKAKITPESHLTRDLGLDSMALASLIFKFDEEFGVDSMEEQDDFDLGSLRTVKDLLRIGREIVDKAGGQ